MRAGDSIDRPVFIVAPHGSGTTLLYKMLARHPEIGFLNRNNKRHPGSPRLAWLRTRLTGRDRPMEAQSVWDRFGRGEDDTRGREQAGPDCIAWYRRTVRTVLQLRGAPRFLAKYPRLSLRLDWLDEIFPGAIFVHLTRDWRGVVRSTARRRRRRRARGAGWFGVRVPGWREMAELPDEVAATRIFAHVTAVLERAASDFGERVVRVSYESLCAEPIETSRGLCARLGLGWLPAFESTLPRNLRSANDRWRRDLGAALVDRLRAEAPELLGRSEEAPEGAAARP